MNKVTVVTVCFNSEQDIAKTMDSVLNQTYTDFEYIIKDGNSKDRTNEIVAEYKTKFEEKGIAFQHISGKDTGPYDAMMIGAKAASNRYVIFMNAGDLFYNEEVLEKIFKDKDYPGVGVVFGDAIMRGDYDALFKGDISLITHRMAFSHQACFAERDLILKYPFEKRFKIVADYNMMITLYQNGVKFEHVDVTVCIYNMDGMSSKNYVPKMKEDSIIKKEHGLKNGTGSFGYYVKLTEAYVKTFIDKVIPNSMKKGLKKFYMKKIKGYSVD